MSEHYLPDGLDPSVYKFINERWANGASPQITVQWLRDQGITTVTVEMVQTEFNRLAQSATVASSTDISWLQVLEEAASAAVDVLSDTACGTSDVLCSVADGIGDIVGSLFD